MKINRISAIILALVMLLSMTACGQESTTENASANEQTVDPASAEQKPSDSPSIVEEEAPIIPPVLTVDSTIFGSADTGNKSTLKHTLIKTSGPGDQTIYYSDNEGNRIAYEEGVEIEQPPVSYTGAAILTLVGENLDDSLIDSSNAVVQLVEGDGYFPEELILHANTLEGTWQDGTLIYALESGDLEWNTGDYPKNDFNSDREWSCFGGDGNGCYTFNLEVSGITYGGAPVAPAVFRVQVYIWGRSASDLKPEYDSLQAVPGSSGITPTEEPQWTWSGDGDSPILCDALTDDFYITWPAGSDASSIAAEDVTVTLNSQYGDIYQLSGSEYTVFSGEGETQIALTFQHPAFTPVYTSMTIEVSGESLSASNTYEVDSVYTYMVQQGGGGVTVDGTTVYYAEDESGAGYLTENEDEALVFDAAGVNDCNVQLILNTLYVTTRVDQTEEKTVNGQEITFTKSYNTRSVSRGSMEGVAALPGYVIYSGGINPNQMWAWSDRYHAGWEPDSGVPTTFPYSVFPYGS